MYTFVTKTNCWSKSSCRTLTENSYGASLLVKNKSVNELMYVVLFVYIQLICSFSQCILWLANNASARIYNRTSNNGLCHPQRSKENRAFVEQTPITITVSNLELQFATWGYAKYILNHDISLVVVFVVYVHHKPYITNKNNEKH